MGKGNWTALKVLNVLMNTDSYLTTEQIMKRAKCERKSVYDAVTSLEMNGFGIDVIKSKTKRQNKYKYIGLFGLGLEE